MSDVVAEILAHGLTETHFHVGPELLPRRYDVLELAAEAARLRATVVLKNHTYPTTPLASLGRSRGAALLGSVVLNRFVGGLNPAAVASAASGNAADGGAKPPFVVWLPTVHARAHLAALGHAFDPRWGGGDTCCAAGPASEEPVVAFDERLVPRPELRAVLDAVAEHGATLATGHLSAAEVCALVPLAARHGVRAVIITHPHYPATELDDGSLADLLRCAGVYAEHCLAVHTIEGVPLERIFATILATDPARTILSTDFGQVASASLEAGFARFARAADAALAPRLSRAEIVAFFTDNPRRALGLQRGAPEVVPS